MQEEPVLEIVKLDEVVAEGSDEDALVPALAAALGPEEVEAELYVKDAGMMLISTVAPDFTWQSGNADIAIRSAHAPAIHKEAPQHPPATHPPPCHPPPHPPPLATHPPWPPPPLVPLSHHWHTTQSQIRHAAKSVHLV